MKICSDEMEQLKAHDYKLVFRQPSVDQTKTVMAGSLKQQNKLKELRDTIIELKRLGMNDDDIKNVLQEK